MALLFTFRHYGKCPKISYTKVSEKMDYANSADPDSTAPGEMTFTNYRTGMGRN